MIPKEKEKENIKSCSKKRGKMKKKGEDLERIWAVKEKRTITGFGDALWVEQATMQSCSDVEREWQKNFEKE